MIKVSVVGGVSINVQYTSGMNAQQAIEEAYSATYPQPTTFSFAVQYYGQDTLAPYGYLGYMVIMINGQFDNPANKSYWQFLLNGHPSDIGIDSTILNDGDFISFESVHYGVEKHAGTSLEKKHLAAQKIKNN